MDEIKRKVYANFGFKNCPEIIFDIPKKVKITDLDGQENEFEEVSNILIMVSPTSELETSLELTFKRDGHDCEYVSACKYIKELCISD